jgi:hypothetical protein
VSCGAISENHCSDGEQRKAKGQDHQHRSHGDVSRWITMNAVHVRAEAEINTRNGFTVDFPDFAIASYLD